MTHGPSGGGGGGGGGGHLHLQAHSHAHYEGENINLESFMLIHNGRVYLETHVQTTHIEVNGR